MHGEELVIDSIQAREILDSRGNPTVEVDVLLASGITGRATVPSGASTGAHEGVELKDRDIARYLGRGVQKAVDNVNEIIAPELEGMIIAEEAGIGHQMVLLDGTEKRSGLGAEKVLQISLACARATAEIHAQPHYHYIGCTHIMEEHSPMMHHSKNGFHTVNNLDFQESMIMPVGARHFKTVQDNRPERESFVTPPLKEKGWPTAVGDEGGVAPNLTQTIGFAGFEPGSRFRGTFQKSGVLNSGQAGNGTEKRSLQPRQARDLMNHDLKLPPIGNATPPASIPEPIDSENNSGLQKGQNGGKTLSNLLALKPNLLLVEDDFMTSQRLSRELREHFNVFQAFTVDDALKKLEQEPFKIILLDLLMGDRSGLEILEKTKVDSELKDVVIAVLTSLHNEEVKEYCLSLGAAEYIEKPETTEELLRTLNCIMYANERSQELQQMISDWTNAFSNFSHDVRGPLHMLQHYLSQIASGLEGKKQKVIQSACTTMKILGLTAEANIQLFGLEAGVTPKNEDKTEVDLLQMMEETIVVYDYKIEEKKIRIDINKRGNSFVVRIAGKRLIYTAYNNLFKNAFEACPDSGTIVLTLDEREDNFIVSIENDGSVSLEMQKQFFEQFSSEKRHGTGLGTYQAKLAVNMIGGEISMHSSIDENKTTVTIVLPKP